MKVEKKGKAKKVLVGVLIVLAILAVTQTLVLGWFGGMGPLRKPA